MRYLLLVLRMYVWILFTLLAEDASRSASICLLSLCVIIVNASGTCLDLKGLFEGLIRNFCNDLLPAWISVAISATIQRHLSLLTCWVGFFPSLFMRKRRDITAAARTGLELWLWTVERFGTFARTIRYARSATHVPEEHRLPIGLPESRW